MTGHLPARHTWLCVTCGQPWPCPERRHHLAAEYQGNVPALGLLMAASFAEAAVDLPHARAGDLWERFLGWVRYVS